MHLGSTNLLTNSQVHIPFSKGQIFLQNLFLVYHQGAHMISKHVVHILNPRCIICENFSLLAMIAQKILKPIKFYLIIDLKYALIRSCAMNRKTRSIYLASRVSQYTC